ncbi:U6 snRNA-associated Sm-like protein LSm2 [Microbotryomycetes sp. JL221]|nr:U6 snRNA-associated Sm-like protein LSm2 [Microbotryomycetes sp. JL221]
MDDTYTVQSTAFEGKQLVALKPIKAGTTIFVEQALLHIHLTHPTINLPTFELLNSQLSRLTLEQRKKFDSLSNSYRTKAALQTKVPWQHLETVWNDRQTIEAYGKWLTNSTRKFWQHHHLFPTYARMNQSCSPNTIQTVNFSTDEMTVKATRDIEINEPITTTEIDVVATFKERQKLYHTEFGFNCACSICHLPLKQLKQSDLNRQEIASMGQLYNKWRETQHLPPNHIDKVYGIDVLNLGYKVFGPGGLAEQEKLDVQHSFMYNKWFNMVEIAVQHGSMEHARRCAMELAITYSDIGGSDDPKYMEHAGLAIQPDARHDWNTRSDPLTPPSTSSTSDPITTMTSDAKEGRKKRKKSGKKRKSKQRKNSPVELNEQSSEIPLVPSGLSSSSPSSPGNEFWFHVIPNVTNSRITVSAKDNSSSIESESTTPNISSIPVQAQIQELSESENSSTSSSTLSMNSNVVVEMNQTLKEDGIVSTQGDSGFEAIERISNDLVDESNESEQAQGGLVLVQSTGSSSTSLNTLARLTSALPDVFNMTNGFTILEVETNFVGDDDQREEQDENETEETLSDSQEQETQVLEPELDDTATSTDVTLIIDDEHVDDEPMTANEIEINDTATVPEFALLDDVKVDEPPSQMVRGTTTPPLATVKVPEIAVTYSLPPSPPDSPVQTRKHLTEPRRLNSPSPDVPAWRRRDSHEEESKSSQDESNSENKIKIRPELVILQSKLDMFTNQQKQIISTNLERIKTYPNELPLNETWSIFYTDASRVSRSSLKYDVSQYCLFTSSNLPELLGSIKALRSSLVSIESKKRATNSSKLNEINMWNGLKSGQSLSLFLSDSEPKWESEWNKQGGRLLLTTHSFGQMFETLIFLIIGGELQELIWKEGLVDNKMRKKVVQGTVVGIVANKRKEGSDRVEIWLAGKDKGTKPDEDWVKKFKTVVAREVGVGELIFSVFKTLTDQQVTVELKNDLSIVGTLKSVDQFLNIKLENIRVVDEDKHPHMMAVRNCFIRGSVVRYVQIPKQAVDTQLLEDATRREWTYVDHVHVALVQIVIKKTRTLKRAHDDLDKQAASSCGTRDSHGE